MNEFARTAHDQVFLVVGKGAGAVLARLRDGVVTRAFVGVGRSSDEAHLSPAGPDRSLGCPVNHARAGAHHERSRTAETLELSASELSAAAREAWRRAARCVGRAGWSSLVLRDSRHLTDPAEVAADLVEHLRETTNGGAIRPMLTVLDPDVRVLSEQLIRYADDPQYAGFVESLRRCGWRSSGRPFEVLPLAVRAQGRTVLHPLPQDAVLEVPITHPALPWFAELGLRWMAVPAIANMFLRVDRATTFPVVFNGWYVSDEISARNLAGPDRYDVLPAVAERLGLRQDRDGYWRQRALVEVEAAVLWSYRAAGVKISSPAQEARRFVGHVEREEAAGREVPSDWSWVISPIAPVLLPTYHRYYAPPDPGAGPDLVQDDDLTRVSRHGWHLPSPLP